jgi:hypothetical protein
VDSIVGPHIIKSLFVRFEVFTAVSMKNVVFWDVAPCRSYMNQRFGGKYRPHLQCRKIRKLGTSMSRWLQTNQLAGSSLAEFSTLKMEAISTESYPRRRNSSKFYLIVFITLDGMQNRQTCDLGEQTGLPFHMVAYSKCNVHSKILWRDNPLLGNGLLKQVLVTTIILHEFPWIRSCGDYPRIHSSDRRRSR